MNNRALQAFLCTTLLFCATSTLAQQNFIKGFTVSLNGDTTNGLVNYRNWRKNPTSIQFKKEANETPISYSAKEIASFGVNLAKGAEVYKAADVEIETSSNYLDHLDKQRAFNTKTDRLFLLKLFKGTYNLYAYENEKEHYFIENGDVITELKFKNYLSDKNIKKNEEFKNQLANLFKACDKITEAEILDLTYSEQALVKILKKYDQCTNVKSEHLQATEKAKLSLAGILASDITRLKISKSNGREADMTSLGNFAIGIAIELKLPRNNRSSSFNIEVLYRRYKFEERVDYIVDNEYHFKHHNYLVGNYAKSNFMYRYQLTLVKLKPFLNVGLSHAFKLSKIDRSTTEKKSSTGVYHYKDPFLLDERGHEQGINLGIGVNINKINIELRAESTNGYSPFQNAKVSVNSLFLNLNYIL